MWWQPKHFVVRLAFHETLDIERVNEGFEFGALVNPARADTLFFVEVEIAIPIGWLKSAGVHNIKPPCIEYHWCTIESVDNPLLCYESLADSLARFA